MYIQIVHTSTYPPVLFILALDQLIQETDTSGDGVKCDRILRIRVLGYADDAALTEHTVEVMTNRLTDLTDTSKREADICIVINMNKTVMHSQHVH